MKTVKRMGKGKEKLVSCGRTLISFYDCLIFLIIFLPMLTNEMETVKGEYVQNIK